MTINSHTLKLLAIIADLFINEFTINKDEIIKQLD